MQRNSEIKLKVLEFSPDFSKMVLQIPTDTIVITDTEIIKFLSKAPKARAERTKEVFKPNIPSLEEFLLYTESIFLNQFKKDFQPYKYSAETKYKAWVDNGWKDGFNKPIKNWKRKVDNTVQHLKAVYGTSNNQSANNGSFNNRNNGSKVDGAKEIIAGTRYFEPS